MISKKLNLSADQTAKLTPILTDRAQKTQALLQDQSLTPDQRHAQMKAIHENTEQQLATVLSRTRCSSSSRCSTATAATGVSAVPTAAHNQRSRRRIPPASSLKHCTA